MLEIPFGMVLMVHILQTWNSQPFSKRSGNAFNCIRNNYGYSRSKLSKKSLITIKVIARLAMDAFAISVTTEAMYKNPSGSLVFFKYITALAMNYNELL